MRLLRPISISLLAAAAAWAQPARVSLAELLAEALRGNPEVIAAQKRYEASRQRPSQASSLPDPMFSPSYNSSGAPWPGAGLGREPVANVGFMVTQEFPFPGKRRLQGEMAQRESEAEFQQYQAAQLGVVSRIKQAYYSLAYAWAAEGVLDRSIDLLSKLLRITDARYSVGRAAQQDILKAQTQLSILETRKVQLERERAAREAEIVSLLNRPPGATLGQPEELKPQSLDAGIEELYAAAGENSPMLRRDEKMIQRAEVALNMARKEYYPDYSLTAGYFNMGGMPDMYMFRADVRIPLYFFRKQRAGVAEQAGALVASRRDLEASNQSLRFRIKDDYLMASASVRLVEMYGKAVIPQATLALESSLSSYETGAVDFLSVLMNYMTAVEYEMNYYEELRSFYLALSRLEEMTAKRLIH
ncbi:MAG: TolC family protein [Bryobacteraceae bacterium]|nr:TolC family protein [Bryobacteraceae bacterium]